MNIIKKTLVWLLWVFCAAVSVIGGGALGLILVLGPSINIGHPATLGLKIEVWLLAMLGFVISFVGVVRHDKSHALMYVMMTWFVVATLA